MAALILMEPRWRLLSVCLLIKVTVGRVGMGLCRDAGILLRTGGGGAWEQRCRASLRVQLSPNRAEITSSDKISMSRNGGGDESHADSFIGVLFK